MASPAESQSNIIPFPSHGAPRPINNPDIPVKRKRGRPRGRKRRMVYACVDLNSVRTLQNFIYLLSTAVRGRAPNDVVLKEMWDAISDICQSVEIATSGAS